VPKKKKNVDTIKIEGLSSKTIEEFSPKEDSKKEDKLWEDYFRGSHKVIAFPEKRLAVPLPSHDIELDKEHTVATLPADVAEVTNVTDATQATAVLNTTIIGKNKRKPKTKEEFVTLDSTHTKSEQMIYSIMYRETITKGKAEEYFSLRKLMKMTGIGSDKTVFNALKGLRNKLSIRMVEHSNNKPTGTLYKLFTPKEIFKLREELGVLIDINTKRIVTTVVTEATAVSNSAQATQVGTTAATSVKSTAVKENIPYIKENKDINNDDSIKNIESSSEDEIFDHKKYIISLYKKYTKNPWRAGDDDFYDTINDVIPYAIEAGVIASSMRANIKINSLAYCEGAIREFMENLPPGYLNYLRDKWKEWKEAGIKEKHHKRLSKRERNKIKKEIGRIFNFVGQARVGGQIETTREVEVKAQCERESISFDEEIYKEILEESQHGRWELRK